MEHSPIAIVTPSYRNDFEYVKDLSASLDRYCRVPFKHILIVPESDRSMFSVLQSANRIVMTKEAVLKRHGFFKLPLPKRLVIPGLIDRRFKEQWYKLGVGRLSGWVIQQLIKLAATEYTDAEVMVFVDSDVLLFRELTADDLYIDGALKLTQKPIHAGMTSHIEWHRNALKLVGAEDFKGDLFNYIGQLICWRRDVLQQLQQRITEVTGEDWIVALAKKRDISEYILYGVFVEAVLAAEQHRQVLDPAGLTCSYWTPDANFSAQAMAATVKPQHVALHIQSTIDMSLAKRKQTLDEVIRLQGVAS
ncbi:DUF6492 family protein [Herbaspirillum sp. YR522]|uniref:DUF6492 family protein n=1 Tax=Herbaspirillum sp. YR522 TaxID=1144342 RepID=UPI00026F7F47|nr:DUF6492 family protein [Herbaspirillum sp. YR522]EJN08095.1 hypothetical protein PMI40_01458 [Herbaspirillum sp. YR522]